MGLPDEIDPNTSSPLGQQLAQMVWDVDNDSDGVPDSIWLDIGMPIQTDASGRRYKPLVAILCQDLDGRLNVNAHSNVSQIENFYATGGVLQPLTPQPFAFPTPQVQSALVPRGLGVGPAEIFLGHLFGPDDFTYILAERYRYDGTLSLARYAGIKDLDDPLSRIKNLGTPFDYYNTLGLPVFP